MSGISYCEKVLEVTGGCDKCSPGCKNCWAIGFVWRMAHNPTMGDKWQGLVEKKKGVLNWTGKIKCFGLNILDKPICRKKRTTYFIDSKADLFHPKVSIGFLTHVFDMIGQCPQHTFLILTKRPKQALKMMWGKHCEGWRYFGKEDFHPNIHFGVSISNQAEADEKIPILLQIPAAVRWLSIEPMLEEIDLRQPCFIGRQEGYESVGVRSDIAGEMSAADTDLDGLGWIVVGGESGPGARPMHPDWPRSIRDQCVAAGVPFDFKQWGEYLHESQGANTDGAINAGGDSKRGWLWPDKTWSIRVGNKKAGCLLDGKTWKQLPK